MGSSYLGGKIYKGSKPGCPRIKPAVVRMGTFFYIYIYMFVCLCRVLVAALGIFSLCCRGRCAGPAGPAVPASDQGGEAQASPPGGLGSRQQASFPSPQHQQRLPDPPAEKVAVICQPHVLRGSGSRLPLALCHRRAQPPCLSQLPRRRRSGCWPVGGASPSASRA